MEYVDGLVGCKGEGQVFTKSKSQLVYYDDNASPFQLSNTTSSY